MHWCIAQTAHPAVKYAIKQWDRSLECRCGHASCEVHVWCVDRSASSTVNISVSQFSRNLTLRLTSTASATLNILQVLQPGWVVNGSVAPMIPLRTRIHRVKWCHISVVAIRSPFCGATPSYCARLSGEDLSRYSNKIESVGLRKCPYYRYHTKKWCQNNKHFAELASQNGGKQLA